MAQILSGDIITILNTTYYTTDKVPFMLTTNYQPFCPDDIGSCMAAGKCNTGGGYNEFFYTITDVQNSVIPYSYSLYYIFALSKGTSGTYNSMANGTKIYAGTYVGFQSVPNLSYMQTGPNEGAIGFDDRIQLQTNSWSDGDGDQDYRVFMFVTPAGDGQNAASTAIPISYGIGYFIQSLGKLTQNSNEQYWKVGDPKYQCAVSTQDVGSLPKNNENYLFYIYDENGEGAPIVYSSGGLPTVQWVFIGLIIFFGIILIILVTFLILSLRKKEKRKKQA